MTDRKDDNADTLAAWRHEAAGVGERGLARHVVATAAQRANFAADNDLVECQSLEADYRIKPLGGGRYLLVARVTARVLQSCVVTLDPVESNLDEKVVLAFWPHDEVPEPASEVDSRDGLPRDEDDPEPIRHGIIEVGRVVAEHLTAAIDPFPRQADAAFDWKDPRDGVAEKPDSPFAKLARLKRNDAD